MAKKRAKLKPDAWMPLFIGDYLADTQHLTTEQHGAYLLLMLSAWRNGGVLQADDTSLRSISRLDESRWQENRTVLLRFFSLTPNGYVQRRLAEEYEHAWEVYDKRCKSGKKGGRPPVARDADNSVGDGENRTVTQTDTRTGVEKETVSPPQSQPQPHVPKGTSVLTDATRETETDLTDLVGTFEGHTPEQSAAAAAKAKDAINAAIALKRDGCPDVSGTNPHLVQALDDGITARELRDLAGEFPGKPIKYLIQTARGRRSDAQGASHVPANTSRPTGRTSLVEQAEAAMRERDERRQRERGSVIEGEAVRVDAG